METDSKSMEKIKENLAEIEQLLKRMEKIKENLAEIEQLLKRIENED